MLTSKGYVKREQAELIVQFIAGGADANRALDALFRPSYGMTWRFIQAKIRNDADTEELLQDTNVRVSRDLARFRGDSKFSSWRLGYANNVVREHIRRNQRIRGHEVTGSAENGDHPNDLVEIGEPDIGGTENLDPKEILRNKETEDHITRLLKECRESISRDPDTGQYDPLLECLTNGWLRAFLTNPEATLEEIGDACGTDHNRAKRVRGKLAACIKTKTGMEWVAERKTTHRRKP